MTEDDLCAVHVLTNPVRHYPWGDQHFIPELLGTEPDGRPYAELWVGGHPDDSSVLADGTAVAALAEQQPERVLGERARREFGDRLPYLCKVLAAAAPLSIQVHPNPEQAERGYAVEETGGVDRQAPERRYTDRYAKPELVLAIGTFEALAGVRPLQRTRELLDGLSVDHPRWAGLARLLPGSAGDDPAGAVRRYLEAVLHPADPGGTGRLGAGLVAAVGAACERRDTPETRTLADLARRHPGDPGVLVALLLNRVTLQPGEAMFLAPGVLHTYLHGAAVEVMGASDNVLRAGLTGKHVDAREVLALAVLDPAPPHLLSPELVDGVRLFRPPTPEFDVATVVLDGDVEVTLPLSGPRVVMALEGEVVLRVGGTQGTRLGRGRTVLVEAVAGRVRVSGKGALVVTGVPTEPSGALPTGPVASRGQRAV